MRGVVEETIESWQSYFHEDEDRAFRQQVLRLQGQVRLKSLEYPIFVCVVVGGHSEENRRCEEEGKRKIFAALPFNVCLGASEETDGELLARSLDEYLASF